MAGRAGRVPYGKQNNSKKRRAIQWITLFIFVHNIKDLKLA